MFSKISRKAYHFFHPKVGEIWCLHRVLEERSPYASNRALEITPSYLEKLISDYKAKGFTFCTIDEMVLATQSHFVGCKKKLANVSFDDGFVDVYTNAFPVLRKHDIPFTIYLTTDFPDGKAFVWWCQLESIINNHEVIETTDGKSYSTYNQEDKSNAFEAITQIIFQSSQTASVTFSELLAKYQAEFAAYRDFALSWEQIAEMVGSGLCTIGSHSVSHPELSKLDEHQCGEELRVSAEVIAEHLGERPRHFSYPHSHCNEMVVGAVQNASYQSAALGYGGAVRRKADLLRLNRNNIVQND